MKVNPYLNFDGQAEEAMTLYSQIFNSQLTVQKMSSVPGNDNLSEEELARVMHASFPIGDNQIIMASDIIPSMGHKLYKGNNNYITINTDTREDATRIFNALAQNGSIEMPLEDMFWGDYFGSLKDHYGVCWMISHNPTYV